MSSPEIRFSDGASYERFMGRWSQPVGDLFLDWLAQPSGLQWLDVGCGNGAFTERIIARCQPKSVTGIDPSPAQLSFARERFASGGVDLHQGDAMAMPFADDAFDVAVMPLVIFFVPTPAKGVTEMARVVRRGGIVSAYAWDMEGGGFPYASVLRQIEAQGVPVPAPPSPQASRLDVMQSLWTEAGLDAIETTALTVQRTFDDFDDYWTTILGSPSAGVAISSLPPDAQRTFKEGLRKSLQEDADGRIACMGRANAVKGRRR